MQTPWKVTPSGEPLLVAPDHWRPHPLLRRIARRGRPAPSLLLTVAKKDNSPHQPESTRKDGTSVLHNVQGTPQGSRRQP
jgi:hypothetical protein